MRFRNYKNRFCRYSHFQLTSNQTEKLFFGHAILYIRTSMCSLCICLIQFLTMYVQTHRKTEGLGQIYTRVILCGQHIRLDYDKQKRTITCQLKPVISIRLQLQVNTCHTLGALLVCIRRWHTLLGGFISN